MQKNYNAFVKWIAISAVVVFVGIFLIFRVGNEEYTLETFFGDIGFTTGIVGFLRLLSTSGYGGYRSSAGGHIPLI